MLASASTVAVVADALRKHAIKKSVVDPVMVATSGSQLLPESAVKTLCDILLPETFILTPNIPEANLIVKEAGLSPVNIVDLESMRKLAAAVCNLGPKYVLLKGGHVPLTSQREVAKCEREKSIVANVLCGDGTEEVFEMPFQHSRNTHCTGCSLASAIACNLASNMGISKAVRSACRYVEAGIRSSIDLGKGSGPINHFHSIQSLPFVPYVLSRELLGHIN